MQSFSSEISSNKHVKPSDSQKKFSFNITFQMEYLLFLPESYAQSTNQKFPLILFLHGAGERGSDLDSVKRHGIPKIVETNPDFPFIAVSPQCPEDSWWTSELHTINGLIEEVVEKYQVDTSRIYLTGLSMGGFGTWSLASMYPERFAAIAPVCGGGEVRQILRSLVEMPIWTFHGQKDDVIPFSRSEEIVTALKKHGSSIKFTIYPEAGHDSWTKTYDNPELYKWFLKHSR
ncbi:prolyl oligopeptidase family serine peptidase [Candidatus Poribacteria bacterium]|nr:prolyl oligopeptidase family serine peptidase [Candidatus Poribacteria bacterium]